MATKSDPFIKEVSNETPTASPEPTDGSTMSRSFTAPQRPPVEKKWATELAPRAGPTVEREPRPRAVAGRARTSYAGRQAPEGSFTNWEQEGYYSSSSSSSDDEEETQRQAEAKGARARREKRQNEIDDYRRFKVGNENYSTSGKVKKDGRLRITVNETANKGYLAKALGSAMKKVVNGDKKEEKDGADVTNVSHRSSSSSLSDNDTTKPRLNIVIMVIGSRGDAQPFLKIGKVLKEEYGHRVRIATHPAFRDFVEKDSGLEFFSVGGDPSELMAFMVKNPGMIPTLEAVKAGDIGKRRAAMAEMFEGFWRACINATDDEHDVHNLKMMGQMDPFVADAIIANPPSFAHIHCAEALGIPLHLMFTFPYTPTQAFPHPLASIKKSNVDPGYTNFISYPLVDLMVWQGLGDLVNDFRTNTLSLDPVSTLWAPGQSYRLHVPFSYLWSPGLVPKPEDWGDEIDVSGFVFLDLASTFTPPDDLVKFLEAGEKPIYIGFGSIVVDDPDKFTEMIFEAVKLAGVRVLLSKGWGGLGGEDVPDNVFMLENTPHDWLFPRVRATVIHGGAGTTAIALKCGKPTMVVPFFGDQHFWGSMLASAGAGPEPVPYKSLSAEKLADGIKYLLTEEAQKASDEIAKDVELEGDGAVNAVRSFHHHLNLTGINSMRCTILRERVACWKLKKSTVKLSALAADIAVEKGFISWKRLELIRHREWNDFEGPGEPVTGVASSLVTSVGNAFGGVGSVPYKMAKTSHKRKEKKKKRRKLKEMRAHRRHVKTTEAAADGGDDNLHQHVETKDVIPPETPSDDKTTQQSAEKHNLQNGAAKDGTAEKETKESHGQPQQNGVANNKGSSGRPDLESRATTGTMSSAETASTLGDPVEEYAEDVNSGLGKTAKAVARAPVDLSMAVAQGFHNAPRLYGDDTVRRPPRVTGIRSGLKAAQHEFAYGVYDAFTGVVRLPYRGAKKEGVAGFVKGTGMGLGGFVIKHLAAFAAPVAYTLRGVAKQADRANQPDRLVRRARIIEGQREAQHLSAAERKDVEQTVEEGWATLKDLWQALEAAEKRKGFKAHLQAKRKRGLNAAFESVQIAEEALAAVNRGDTVSTVVGTEKELKKLDENQTLPHRRTSADTGRTSTETRGGPGKRSSGERSRSRDSKGGAQTNGGAPEKQKKPRTTDDIPEDTEGEERQEAVPDRQAMARVRSVG
jgi:UDP:flavonoid glycosyltransferase YjiC (YdhE family)